MESCRTAGGGIGSGAMIEPLAWTLLWAVEGVLVGLMVLRDVLGWVYG